MAPPVGPSDAAELSGEPDDLSRRPNGMRLRARRVPPPSHVFARSSNSPCTAEVGSNKKTVHE
jgi:hypothetical protein